MLNGVEVLNVSKVNDGIFWIALSIVFLVVFLIGLIYTIAIHELNDVGFGLMIFGLILSVIFFVLYLQPQSRPYNQYQVTISDNVKMKEFNEKYEVIDVDGEIYTIREKDGE